MGLTGEVWKELKKAMVAGVAGAAGGDTAGDVAGDLFEIRGDLYELLEDDDGDELDNANFTANGYDDPSPETLYYFKKQWWISRASFTAGAAGKVSSWFLGGWNVSDLAQQGSGARNAYLNLGVFRSMVGQIPRGGSLAQRLDMVIRMKQIKLASRGAGLASGFVPYGSVVGAVGNIAKGSLVEYWDKDLIAFAAGIHWRAFTENRIGRGQATGPSGRIVHQLFNDYTTVGALAAESRDTIDRIIAEPKGWLVILDKVKAM